MGLTFNSSKLEYKLGRRKMSRAATGSWLALLSKKGAKFKIAIQCANVCFTLSFLSVFCLVTSKRCRLSKSDKEKGAWTVWIMECNTSRYVQHLYMWARLNFWGGGGVILGSSNLICLSYTHMWMTRVSVVHDWCSWFWGLFFILCVQHFVTSSL